MNITLTDEEIDQIVERVSDRMTDILRSDLDDDDSYIGRAFKVAWMRLMESECNDLEYSTRTGACPHGQYMYRGIFNVINEYFKCHDLGVSITEKEDSY